MSATDPDPWCVERAGGVEIDILVVPRAAKTRVVGLHDGRLKIQLTAPPVDGAANGLLLAFLAEALGLRKAAVVLLAGEGARRKRVRVDGVARAQVLALVPEDQR